MFTMSLSNSNSFAASICLILPSFLPPLPVARSEVHAPLGFSDRLITFGKAAAAAAAKKNIRQADRPTDLRRSVRKTAAAAPAISDL